MAAVGYISLAQLAADVQGCCRPRQLCFSMCGSVMLSPCVHYKAFLVMSTPGVVLMMPLDWCGSWAAQDGSCSRPGPCVAAGCHGRSDVHRIEAQQLARRQSSGCCEILSCYRVLVGALPPAHAAAGHFFGHQLTAGSFMQRGQQGPARLCRGCFLLQNSSLFMMALPAAQDVSTHHCHARLGCIAQC